MLNAEQFKFHLARYAKVSEADAAAFVDAVSQVLIDRVKAGEEVEIQGLGTFSVIETQQGRRLALQVDERMRAAVNAPFACFEPVIVANAPRPAEPVAEPAEEPIEPIVANEPEPTEEPAAADEPTLAPVETVADALVENSSVALGNIVAAVSATKAAEEVAESVPETATPLAKNEEKPTPEKVEEKPVANAPRPRRVREEEKSLMDILQEKLPAVKPWMWGAIVGAIVLIILIVVLANVCSGSEKKAAPKPEPTTEVAQDTASAETTVVEPATQTNAEAAPSAKKSQPEPTTSVTATPSAKSKQASRPGDEQLWMEDGEPKMASLGDGGRLTLVALRNYGDKAFWAYIYDVNAFQLGDPNNVPIGKPLYLPNPSYYRIDANDPASIKRAQNRAMQILNEWK